MNVTPAVQPLTMSPQAETEVPYWTEDECRREMRRNFILLPFLLTFCFSLVILFPHASGFAGGVGSLFPTVFESWVRLRKVRNGERVKKTSPKLPTRSEQIFLYVIVSMMIGSLGWLFVRAVFPALLYPDRIVEFLAALYVLGMTGLIGMKLVQLALLIKQKRSAVLSALSAVAESMTLPVAQVQPTRHWWTESGLRAEVLVSKSGGDR